MTYPIVVTLSVIATFLGFAVEIASGNIAHVKNGREPNAGAAVFPIIPFVPVAVVAVTWLLDRCYPDLGFWIVTGLFSLYVPVWGWHISRLNAELRSLMTARRNEVSGRPETDRE